MATDVIHDDSVAAPPAPPPAARREKRPQLYRHRFLVAYGALALALGATAAGIVIALGGRIGAAAPAWSSWQPSGGGLGAAEQIAAHVAPLYRLPDGKQLVDVIAKAPSVSPGNQTIPVHYIAVRGTAGKGDTIVGVSSSNSVMYSLCGLGPSCSIADGKPSVARGRLVRREILQLALYTFRYVPGVDSVVAFMPPRLGTNPQYVVFLQKGDLAGALSRPLAATLGPETPLPNTIPAREVRVVDATTESRVYTFTLSQSQQGDAILVLAPLPA